MRRGGENTYTLARAALAISIHQGRPGARTSFPLGAHNFNVYYNNLAREPMRKSIHPTPKIPGRKFYQPWACVCALRCCISHQTKWMLLFVFLFRCNEGRARLITRTLCDWLWRWQADVVVKHTYAICALIKLLFRSLEPARQWPAADLCADIVLIVISTSESWLIWIYWARESSNLPMCYTHEPHCKNIN